MKPPINTKIFEGHLATFWFDEQGILYAKAKNVPRNLQVQKENYEFIKQITGNKKVCLLSYTSTSHPPDKETRDYIERELPNYIKAMAVISKTATGKIIPNIFVAINSQPIPIQFFDTQAQAKQWLQQYL
ncbi:MAG TPA: STAS/SEC14 domain-containing protein [Bacteroidia bacterium]|nr:STAS/SEC14 domain-containing protein [Bacteroidia bacterium]